MTSPAVVHNTFTLERAFPVAAERVFAALADPVRKRRWFAEGAAHDVLCFAMDFHAGGIERAEYRMKDGTPFAGVILEHVGTFLDIASGQRVVTSSTMSFGGRRISAALVTLEIVANDAATTLRCTHQAAYFEGADGPTIREAGWRSLLDKLVAEVAQNTQV